MSLLLQRLAIEAEVEAVVPDWLRLHAVSASSTPFNHPTWILSWWRERQDLGLRWSCYVGRDRDGGLIAILPLVRYPEGAVRFAGHDLHDVAANLVDEPGRVETWRKMIENSAQLEANSTLDLPTLSDKDMDALRLLAGNHLHIYDIDPGARIELPAAWDEYWAALPTKRQKRMRTERRALEQDHGPVRLDVVDGGADLVGAVDEFWALREVSWQTRGRYAKLADHVRGVAMRSFLGELASASKGSGLTAVAHLTAGNHTIGSALLLRAGQRTWYSMCTFAPQFAEYGPGRLLLAECVRSAIAEGQTHLELGRGVEEYKFALGATRYELSNVALQLGTK